MIRNSWVPNRVLLLQLPHRAHAGADDYTALAKYSVVGKLFGHLRSTQLNRVCAYSVQQEEIWTVLLLVRLV